MATTTFYSRRSFKFSFLCVVLSLLCCSAGWSQVIQWSTYLNSSGDDYIIKIVKDNAGDIYVLGTTNGTDFPTTPGAFQTSLAPGSTNNITLSKISAATGNLVWSTYLGGTNDWLYATWVTWDSVSNTINISASSQSYNYPVVNGRNKTGGSTWAPVFSQFNAASGSMLYSTYVFTIEPYGISGFAFNNRFINKDGYGYFVSVDATLTKVLISKFDMQAHQFVYQKVVGGNNGFYNGNFYPTYGWDITVENGEVYVSGTTNQDDFPTTTGSFQPVYPAGSPLAYFITKLTASGEMGFSTFAGRFLDFDPNGFNFTYTKMAVGSKDLAFAARFDSTLPVSANGIQFNDFETANTGIMKLNKNTGALTHFTYIAPSSDYFPIHNMRNIDNELIIYGTTTSNYLPVTANALQPRNSLVNNPTNGKGDGYFMHIDSSDNILYCSYLGGNGDDYYWTDQMSINKDNICFTGYTNSNNLITTPNATQSVNKNTFSQSLEIVIANYNRSKRAITYSSYMGSNVGDYIRESDFSNGYLSFNSLASQNSNSVGFISSDYPVSPDAFQKTLIGSGVNNPMGYESRQYIGRIDVESGKLVYGSYISTSLAAYGEQANSMVANGDDIFTTGLTSSNDYPVTAGAVSSSYKAGYDGFITKISLCYNQVISDTLSPKVQLVCANSLVDKITGSVPQLGNTPVILRNGVVQASQADQTNFAYQWQQSTDSLTWTAIQDAIEKDYSPDPVAFTTYFRRIAKPAFCNNTDTSTVATIALNGHVPTKPDVGGDGEFFTCPGSSINLGTPTQPGVTYSWQPASNLSVTNVAQVVFNGQRKGAFTYILTSLDTNGCTAKDTATVFNYGASAGPDKALCPGKPSLLGGAALSGLSGMTYNWTPAGGLSCTNCAQPLVNGIGNNYVLTVTMPLQSGATCTTKDTVLVYIGGTLPNNPAGSDQAICATDSAILGTPRVSGYHYFWTPGWYISAITDTAQPVFNQFHDELAPNYDPVNFILTATNNTGCTIVDTASVYILHIDIPYYQLCRPAAIGMRDYTRGEAIYEWVDVTSGTEMPVAPGELSSTNTSVCTALLTPTVTTTKVYRLKMTWHGKTCSKDVTVALCNGGYTCNVRINFKSKNNCPTVTSSDSLTLSIAEPDPNMDYYWSPATGLNTTTGTVVKTGATSVIVYKAIGVYRYDNTIFCYDTIKVNPPNAFAPVFQAPDTILCKNATANIGQPTVVGLDYSWTSSISNGQSVANVSDPQITAADNIFYYAKVTDMGTGCFTNDTVFVKVPVLPSNPHVTLNSCINGGFTIGAPAIPGFVYQWFPSTGLSNAGIAQPIVVSNTSSLNYVRVCTEPISGCNSLDVVTIQHIDTPSITLIQPPPICQGANSSVKIGNPKLDSVTYSWSPSAGLNNASIAQPIASPSATTTYTLTANFTGGCAAAAVASVTVYVLPRPTVTATVINNCITSQLGVSSNAAAPKYTWSPATGLDSINTSNPIATVTFPVSYTVMVTDTATGCANTSSVLVNPTVAANAGGDKTLCSGSSVQIGTAPVSGVSYSWSPGTGLSNYNTAITQTLNTLPIGTYTYVLTATGSTCSKSDTVEVIVNKTPQLNIDSAFVICKNATVQIGTSPQPGVLYVWSPATALSNAYSSNPYASPLQTTSYNLTAINLINSCSLSANTVVTVNTTGAPVVNATAGSMCTGNSTSLIATVTSPGSFSYEWTPDYHFITSRFTSNPVVSPDVTTTYQVSVTNNANGCANTATTTVVVKDTCNLFPLLWLDFAARLENKNVRLTWTVAMEQNNKWFVIERSSDGRYWTTIGTVNSLGNTDQRRVYESYDMQPNEGVNFYRIKQVDYNGRYTYTVIRQILVINQQSGIVVYPNPTSDVVHYVIPNFASGGHYQLRLTGIDGRLIHNYSITNSQGSLSMKDLSAGVYVLGITNGKGVSDNKKIVLQR